MPSATDLASLLRCAHRVYLDAHGDASEKAPSSAFLQLLWEGGRAHEDTVIAGLDAVSAHTDFRADDRIVETARLMGEGHPFIYHGYFRTVNDIPYAMRLIEQAYDKLQEKMPES